jgi:hypothetical protein
MLIVKQNILSSLSVFRHLVSGFPESIFVTQSGGAPIIKALFDIIFRANFALLWALYSGKDRIAHSFPLLSAFLIETK